MRLLVSVSDAAEASAALNGGADIIDAKNPAAGPLGAVAHDVFRRIDRVVAGTRPLTAALGDALDPDIVEADARAFVLAGAMLVKVGFAGLSSASLVSELLRRAVRGAATGARERAGPTPAVAPGVVAVAYADADRAASLRADALFNVAARQGARGVLLDTFDKRGPGLRALLTVEVLAGLITISKRSGLLTALAGQLTAADFAWIHSTDVDIVGVRGAACEDGRMGRVTSTRVQALRAKLRAGLISVPARN